MRFGDSQADIDTIFWNYTIACIIIGVLLTYYYRECEPSQNRHRKCDREFKKQKCDKNLKADKRKGWNRN